MCCNAFSKGTTTHHIAISTSEAAVVATPSSPSEQSACSCPFIAASSGGHVLTVQ